MLTIIPISAFQDNYIWLIQHEREILCIDPGDAAPVIEYLRNHDLNLSQIWLTHHHHDHIGGVVELKKVFPECVVFGNKDISEVDKQVGEGDTVSFAGCEAAVWHVPGHTATHLAYLLKIDEQMHVFCGDTLFSAGCGRVFTGTMEQLHASLQRFASLSQNALFYPAHEYTASNLRFAAHVEPDNIHVSAAQVAAQNIPSLPVSLAHVLKINPFLRIEEPQLIAQVEALLGAKLNNNIDVFTALREMKNTF